MKKLIAALSVVVLAACTSPQKSEPEILSTFPVAQTANTEDADNYLVRINFVLFKDEIAKWPNAAKAFHVALSEWAVQLPIECCVFVEEVPPFPLILFNPPQVSDQRGIIRVHFADIQAPPYNTPEGVLGFWAWEYNELAMSGPMLENDPDRAHMVALHELGHVFGLPHFMNMQDMRAITGDYIVSNASDARTLVMFPVSSFANKQSPLSKLEVLLARKNLLTLQEIGRTNCFRLTTD